MIFLEFRTIKDKLIKKGEFLSSYERFHGHYRRFIKLADFEKVITQNKFKIFYKKTSNRFSIYKKDKPHLARYILKLSTDR